MSNLDDEPCFHFEWKSTHRDEYPTDGEECLIYFKYTGYHTSTYHYYPNDPWTKHVFSDEGGFLGDENVLWISKFELQNYISDGIADDLIIPQDYLDLFKE